ncbi:MAG: hypothetical protein ACO3EZ_19655, partial [Prochlorotrichaceae cyanobacterium]
MAELKLLTEQRSSDANVLPYAHGFYGNWGVFRGCDRLSPEIEYPENASRSPALANKLQACIDNPVGGTALRITCDFALSSSEGDEFGVSVEEDPAIRNRSSNRIIGLAQRALSGFTLEDYWQIVWRFLAWGDCFASVVEDDGGRLRPLLLPTWQVHLEADEWTGQITRAFQRRPSMVGKENERNIDLETFVHWCYCKNHLYGRSLYWCVRDEAEYYKQNSEDISIASRKAALNPNIHIMPEGADSAFLQAYKSDHRQQLKQGPVSDIYLYNGGEVKQANANSSPLISMTDSLERRAKAIAIASRVPPYLLGVESPGAKEISMQPAMMFKLHVGMVRSKLASELYKLVDRYLAARELRPPYPYRLVFPKIELNPYQQGMDEDLD